MNRSLTEVCQSLRSLSTLVECQSMWNTVTVSLDGIDVSTHGEPGKSIPAPPDPDRPTRRIIL